jgi:4-hydroxyphenylpyruvate dioxygenase
MFSEGAERRRLLDAFDESCRWAAALGCTTVMSPVDRGPGPVDRAARSVREVGDIAARHAVRLALEFNSQAEQFNTLAAVREVLAQAAHPHCGVLLDTYHFGRSGGDPAHLDSLSPEEIVYIQFSDVPQTGLEPGKALDRLPPGQGSVPFRAIFRRPPVAAYTGYLSYEAPNPAAWSRDPDTAAREALVATRAALTDAPSGR